MRRIGVAHRFQEDWLREGVKLHASFYKSG